MNYDSNTFPELVEATLGGNAQAGEVLASALTTMFNTMYPNLHLSPPKCYVDGDFRKLRWFGPFGDEFLRLALLEEGEIIAAFYNFSTQQWGGLKHPDITDFLADMFLAGLIAVSETTTQSKPSIDPRRSRPYDGLN